MEHEIPKTIETIMTLVDMSQDLRINWKLSEPEKGYIVVENEGGFRFTYNENPEIDFDEILKEPVL